MYHFRATGKAFLAPAKVQSAAESAAPFLKALTSICGALFLVSPQFGLVFNAIFM
jgi:hypothetical protein